MVSFQIAKVYAVLQVLRTGQMIDKQVGESFLCFFWYQRNALFLKSCINQGKWVKIRESLQLLQTVFGYSSQIQTLQSIRYLVQIIALLITHTILCNFQKTKIAEGTDVKQVIISEESRFTLHHPVHTTVVHGDSTHVDFQTFYPIGLLLKVCTVLSCHLPECISHFVISITYQHFSFPFLLKISCFLSLVFGIFST